MKKAKFVALALVLAFALLGAGYAAWTDHLEVNGTVTTGDIDVKFTKAESSDPGETVDPASLEFEEEHQKHVGATEVEISEDGKELIVTVSNAYPGYFAHIDFEVTNNGSVPVRLQSKDIIVSDEDALLVENHWFRCSICGRSLLLPAWLGGCPGHSNPDPDPDPDPLLDIGTQIHAGETVQGSVGHLVKDDAEQNGEYSYTVSYDYIQWNLFEEAE